MRNCMNSPVKRSDGKFKRALTYLSRPVSMKIDSTIACAYGSRRPCALTESNYGQVKYDNRVKRRVFQHQREIYEIAILYGSTIRNQLV